MNSELAGEINMHGEQVKWSLGERFSILANSVYVIDLLQTSSDVVLQCWNAWETSQQRPNNTMKLLHNIQLHCLSIRTSHKTYS